jgi:hypothetical protein
MTAAEALAFVRTHGVVLEAAAGPVPSLASAIAGGPVAGSWWAHARGREIFALTRAVRDCPDIVVCRLVDGKVTYVHRRLWPAVVRVAGRFPRRHLAAIREKHTGTGRHVSAEVPIPDWACAALCAEARRLDVATALAALGAWCRK